MPDGICELNLDWEVLITDSWLLATITSWILPGNDVLINILDTGRFSVPIPQGMPLFYP